MSRFFTGQEGWAPERAKAAREGIAQPLDLFRAERLWLALILFLALVVRLRFVDHFLAWDEAKLMLSLRELVRYGNVDIYFRIHGPGYMLFAVPVAYLTGVSQMAVGLFSVLASLGCVWLTWLVSRDLFDRDTAAFAALALAAMPLNVIFSTWVKQDSLMTLFVLAAVYLFAVKGRWLLACLPLAAAILTKEYALLVVPSLLAWTLATFQWRLAGRWLVTSALGAAGGLWYFVLFAVTGGQFLEGFFGAGMEAQVFGRPWYQYFVSAPIDLGPIVTGLVLVGSAYGLWRWLKDDFGYVLPLAWASMVYLVHSIGAVKGQWYVYQATPALAMLAGVAVAYLLRLVASAGRRRVAAALIALGIVLPAARLDYLGYLAGRSTGSSYVNARQVGRWIGRHAKPGDRVAMADRMRDPVVTYYSGLREDDVIVVPSVIKAGILRFVGEEIPYPGEEEDFIRFVREQRVTWVTFSPIDAFPAEKAVSERLGGPAFEYGDWAVVDVSPLWRKKD